MAVAEAPLKKHKTRNADEMVRFNRTKNREFFKTLKKRVDGYFKENNVSRNADWRMKLKTVTMISAFIGPFIAIVAGVTGPLFFAMWAIMGFALAGIGMSVMHDANHGSYSTNPKVNKIVGLVLNFVGGFDTTWRIQHNVLHHTYTNVSGLDEDINQGALLRLSPHDPLQKHHRYQWLYVWALYSLLSAFWMVLKDFKQLVQYNRRGLLVTQRTTFAKEMTALIITKVFHFGYMFGLPMAIAGVSFGTMFAGWMVMHVITGITLSLIFQAAHVVEDIHYSLPDENNQIDEDWAVQQIKATANFAKNNRFLNWYVGGLNYQIEHHLFPNICHVHYPAISGIVEEVAHEFDLPYRSAATFGDAVRAHVGQLKRLGRA